MKQEKIMAQKMSEDDLTQLTEKEKKLIELTEDYVKKIKAKMFFFHHKRPNMIQQYLLVSQEKIDSFPKFQSVPEKSVKDIMQLLCPDKYKIFNKKKKVLRYGRNLPIEKLASKLASIRNLTEEYCVELKKAGIKELNKLPDAAKVELNLIWCLDIIDGHKYRNPLLEKNIQHIAEVFAPFYIHELLDQNEFLCLFENGALRKKYYLDDTSKLIYIGDKCPDRGKLSRRPEDYCEDAINMQSFIYQFYSLIGNDENIMRKCTKNLESNITGPYFLALSDLNEIAPYNIVYDIVYDSSSFSIPSLAKILTKGIQALDNEIELYKNRKYSIENPLNINRNYIDGQEQGIKEKFLPVLSCYNNPQRNNSQRNYAQRIQNERRSKSLDCSKVSYKN